MPTPRPAYDRVMAKVQELSNGCKVWTGTKTGSKVAGVSVYGVIVADHPSLGGPGGYAQVHRVVWEQEIGPIPDGMTLDHVCENHICVNVKHLQLATRSENTRLRWERHPAPDVCAKGHSNWKYNTVRSGKEEGRVVRRCRTCQAEADRDRKART